MRHVQGSWCSLEMLRSQTNVSERLVLGRANAGLLFIHVACLPPLTEVSQTDEGHTGWQAWNEADGKLMLVQALASHDPAQEIVMAVVPENMCLLPLPLAGAGRKKRCLQVCSHYHYGRPKAPAQQ